MSQSLTKIEKNKYKYNRSSSIQYDNLCSILSSKYQNNKCIVTPSGMSSIDLAFNTVFVENKWQTINIVYSWELYCDVPTLLEYYKKIYPNMNITLYELQNQLLLDIS